MNFSKSVSKSSVNFDVGKSVDVSEKELSVTSDVDTNLLKAFNKNNSINNKNLYSDNIEIMDFDDNKNLTATKKTGPTPEVYEDILIKLSEKGEASHLEEKVSEDVNLIKKATFMGVRIDQKDYNISEETLLSDPDFNHVIEAALDCKGVSYVNGSGRAVDKDGNQYSTPKNGTMDCSSFVSYCFNKAGYDCPTSNCVAIKNSEICSLVSSDINDVSDVKPGDIILFKNTYKAGTSHIGIYIGDGKMLHCNKGNYHSGVNVQTLSESYWKQHFEGYYRLEKTKTIEK